MLPVVLGMVEATVTGCCGSCGLALGVSLVVVEQLAGGVGYLGMKDAAVRVVVGAIPLLCNQQFKFSVTSHFELGTMYKKYKKYDRNQGGRSKKTKNAGIYGSLRIRNVLPQRL